MTTRQQTLQYLQQIGEAENHTIDLFEAAIQLASLDYPKDNLQPYHDHKALLIDEVANAMRGHEDNVAARIQALRQILVEKHHYHGDSLTYDDLQNANLIRVVDRRMGLPITLGILFQSVAEGMGWDAEGINFPGHYLLRLEAGGVREMVDPFHEGQLMDAARLRVMLKVAMGQSAELMPDHYLPMTKRNILLRLQNNIKLRHVQSGRVEHAIKTVEIMMMFAPADAALWREQGLLLAALGEFGEAIKAIEIFQDRADSETAKRQAALILQQIKNQVE